MAFREYVRVKDKGTGHKFSVPVAAFNADTMQQLKQDAVDAHGIPLPAEHAAPQSPSSQSGQKANTTTKETS